MSITHVDKFLSTKKIESGGTLDVTLCVTAEPNAAEEPADIALVLDRSSSMAGKAMYHLKAGAKEFIDIVTGRGCGNRIGIVSFAGEACIDVPLTEDAQTLKQAVDALQAQGNTNHADAFEQAGTLFCASTNKKVLVIFTDGETTVGPDPAPIAAALRDSGVEIYCVGLVGHTGLDEETLRCWASEPVDDHVFTTPNAEELERVFCDMADVIAGAGATNIRIKDVVSAAFEITGFEQPNIGRARVENTQAIRWRIPKLADTCKETATLTFHVRHVGQECGMMEVNESIRLTDDAGEIVEFPSPRVKVDCGSIVVPDCPKTVDVHAAACQETVCCDAGEITMTDQGCILQVNFVLHNVCPNRRTCVGIIVTERMGHGVEASCGFKTLVVPAHNGTGCRDVRVMGVPFVLPERPDHCGCATSGCKPRDFRVRILAHPMDYTWNCCDATPAQNRE